MHDNEQQCLQSGRKPRLSSGLIQTTSSGAITGKFCGNDQAAPRPNFGSPGDYANSSRSV